MSVIEHKAMIEGSYEEMLRLAKGDETSECLRLSGGLGCERAGFNPIRTLGDCTSRRSAELHVSHGYLDAGLKRLRRAVTLR